MTVNQIFTGHVCIPQFLFFWTMSFLSFLCTNFSIIMQYIAQQGHGSDLILKDNIKTVRGSYVACIFSCGTCVTTA